MDNLLLVARLALASIFLVSGLAKLQDRLSTNKMLEEFGLTSRLAIPAGVILPLVELTIAIVLIPRVIAWYGAISALSLLIIFSVAIGFNLLRGRTPPCNCFGQLNAKPISWKTLVRNVIFISVAGFIVWYGRVNPGLSVFDWNRGLSLFEQIGVLSLILNGLLIAAVGWILFLLWHQQGRILARLEVVEMRSPSRIPPHLSNNDKVAPIGLPIGSEAPDFAIRNVSNQLVTRDELLAPGKPLLLLFTDPNCGPCNALLPKVAYWQQAISGQLSIGIISRGESQNGHLKDIDFTLENLLLQGDREIATVYQVTATPSVILIDPDGRVASPVIAGGEAITALVDQIVVDPKRFTRQNDQSIGLYEDLPIGKGSSPLALGESLPVITLLDIDGQSVNLGKLKGQNTLILFWDPDCGHCLQMLPQLRAWEIFPPKDTPHLLLVSTGSVEANRTLGLTTTILIDSELEVVRHFGAKGTPSGVLIDVYGRIASSLIEGSPAILKLLQKAS